MNPARVVFLRIKFICSFAALTHSFLNCFVVIFCVPSLNITKWTPLTGFFFLFLSSIHCFCLTNWGSSGTEQMLFIYFKSESCRLIPCFRFCVFFFHRFVSFIYSNCKIWNTIHGVFCENHSHTLFSLTNINYWF